jgi:multidrug efflux pump subunit AcrA (membrane-fusion protein)
MLLARLLIIIIGVLFLPQPLMAADNPAKSHSKSKKKNKYIIVIAKEEKTTTHLYYKGTIQPIETKPVISPVEGRVTEIHFEYGDQVKDKAVLIALSSNQLEKDYRDAVSGYLQKKMVFESGKQSYKGDIELHKAGVISDEEFANNKKSYQSAILDFYASKLQLEKVLSKVHVERSHIDKLSLDNQEAIDHMLRREFRHINVVAPTAGIALFPASDGSSGGDEEKQGELDIGSVVKENQRILSVGDLSGFSLRIKVSEIDVNRIEPGFEAVITGDAFPDTVLKGKVVSVASQADPSESSSSSLSFFDVSIKVPKISSEERRTIHVGMTAKIDIGIENPSQILLPLSAIQDKEGKISVTILDPTTNKPKVIPVVTGETTVEKINIVKGIKPGDKVIIPKEVVVKND